MVSKGLYVAMFVHNFQKKNVNIQIMTSECKIVQDLIISSTMEVNICVKGT